MVRKRRNSVENSVSPRQTRRGRVKGDDAGKTSAATAKRSPKTPTTEGRTTRARGRKVTKSKNSSDSDNEPVSKNPRRIKKRSFEDDSSIQPTATRSRKQKDVNVSSESLNSTRDTVIEAPVTGSKQRGKKKNDSLISEDDSSPIKKRSPAKNPSPIKVRAKKLPGGNAAQAGISKVSSRNNSLISEDESPTRRSTPRNSSRINISNNSLFSEDGSTLVEDSLLEKTSKATNKKKVIDTPKKPSPRIDKKTFIDTVTPESSPMVVSLTPHRSTKTPKKSPKNLSSPKTHTQTPLRLSKTPRKLTVAVESPATSDKSGFSSNHSTPKSQDSRGNTANVSTKVSPTLEKAGRTMKTLLSQKSKFSKSPKIVLKSPKSKSPSPRKKLGVLSTKLKKTPLKIGSARSPRKVSPKSATKLSPTILAASSKLSVSPNKLPKSPGSAKSSKSPGKLANSPGSRKSSTSPKKLAKSPGAGKSPKSPKKLARFPSSKKLSKSPGKLANSPGSRKSSTSPKKLAKSPGAGKSPKSPKKLARFPSSKKLSKSPGKLANSPGSRKSSTSPKKLAKSPGAGKSPKSPKKLARFPSSKKLSKTPGKLARTPSPQKLPRTPSPKKSQVRLSKRSLRESTSASKIKKSPIKTPSPRSAKLPSPKSKSPSVTPKMKLRKGTPAKLKKSPVKTPRNSPTKSPTVKTRVLLASPTKKTPRVPKTLRHSNTKSTGKKRSPSRTSGTPSRTISTPKINILRKSTSKLSLESPVGTPKITNKILNVSKSLGTLTPRGKIRRSLNLTPDFRTITPEATSSPIHTPKGSSKKSPLVPKLVITKYSMSSFTAIEDESIPLMNDSQLMNANESNGSAKDGTYEVVKHDTFTLEGEKTNKENATYELDEPKTPNLRRKSRKRSLSVADLDNSDPEVKRRCRVRFASPVQFDESKSGAGSGSASAKSNNLLDITKRKKTPGVVGAQSFTRARSLIERSVQGTSLVKGLSSGRVNISLRRRSNSLSNVEMKTPVSKTETKARSNSVSDASARTPRLSAKAQNSSVNRLSRPKAALNSEKKSDTRTPVARKAPNFALIHQKKFEKMESLVDAKRRVAERHMLLNNSGSATTSNLASKIPKFAGLLPSQKAGPSDATNGIFNRFGFKLRKSDAKDIITKKQKPVKTRAEKTRENRTLLKNVRTNRRFELQMKSRNLNQ